jgi:predicted DNA-binding WGR domain protein
MQEFRTKQTRGRTRYWIIDLAADVVSVVWGDITEDGVRNQHGETNDRKEPKGKANTKAFVSAEDNAKFHYDRLIRKKTEEGYREVGLDGVPLLGDVESIIDHNGPLPKNLCFSKPKNSVDVKFLKSVDEGNKVLYTRKVNGMMIVAHIREDNTVSLYSRRMDDMTGWFPHLVEALQDMKIPTKTIMLFEGFHGKGCDKKDLNNIQSIMRSLPERALERQEEIGWAKFCLLRIPVLRGVNLEETMTMRKLIHSMDNDLGDKFIDYRNPRVKGRFLYTMELFEGTSEEALKIAVDGGYEGWVGYVKEAVLGDKSFSFNGKPDRSSSCFKLKPDEEDDFIAYWNPDEGTQTRPLGAWGTGKNKSRVGTFSLYQIGKGGKEVYLAEVGSGLTDTERDLYTDTTKFPLVVQVKFEERFYVSQGDKTNALHHPRVTLIRTDKSPEECVNYDLT